MCGIVGFIDYEGCLNLSKANSALASIIHRGPDSTNYITDSKNYFFGHNRLSIIDLSTNANQPFLTTDHSYFIVFNGEIYNYLELRKKYNLSCRTNSDTEVILEGFLKNGVSFFSELRGMYAFIIGENKPNGEYWIVRDPVGIKPLYFSISNKSLAVSSEIKSILTYLDHKPKINENAISSYINTGYIAEPDTAYIGIESLVPGYFMHYQNGEVTQTKFFEFDFDNDNSHKIDSEEIKQSLEKSIERNLVADIELSVALSGGLDSSIIYYLSNKIKPNILALSVAMSDITYDETQLSKSYSDFLNGNFKKITIDDTLSLDLIDELLDHFDQPYADSSLLPVYFLTKSSREFTKVILSGDGGDEIFNGYPFMTYANYLIDNQFAHLGLKLLNKASQLVPNPYSRLIERLYNVSGKADYETLFDLNAWIPRTTSYQGKSIFVRNKDLGFEYDLSITKNHLPNTQEGKIIYYSFRKILQSDYLRKTDMMSMKNSLELRVPMLDEDLVSLAFKIPFSDKSSLTSTKIPLRKIHSEYYKGIGSKMKKQGFRIPLDVYLSVKEKEKMMQLILKQDSYCRTFITSEYLQFLGKQFLNYSEPKLISRDSVYQRVFLLYSLERWHSKQI